ncbi:MAG: aminotransferase [Pseudomonadota bacterium]
MAQVYPFTDPKQAEEKPPTVMVSGHGCFVTSDQGKTYLDGVAGLWCASLGFSNERLIAAADAQMKTLPYYHSFMGRTTDRTNELAAKLASLLPGDLNHVFFGCSGSDAVETAAKIVRFYWNAKGKPEKKHIIAREAAYHGSASTSAGLTGMDYCHTGFDLPAPDILRTGRPHYYSDAKPGESELDFSKRRAAQLEDLILEIGPERVGAFIGEPVIGSGGVIPPPEGYWAEIQAVLKRHGVLLIADEIITGFGRTGAWFASQRYGLQPDLMTMAKQLTSAYFPVSAVAISDGVRAGLANLASELGTFGHGFTYGGHPVGCAVALETLAIYEEMDLPRHVQRLGAYLEERLAPLSNHPAIGDIRVMGLMGGVQFHEAEVAKAALEACEERGLLLRRIDGTIAISPPYVITEAELDQLVDLLTESLQAVAGERHLEARRA